ncbi:MAG: hypothetical protein HY509_00430 [Acidobacteria bacterium]|nr:hypothetical protein [Acidobacteriota bacterium]
MPLRFRNPSPGAGILAAAVLLTAGALLVAACGGDEGTPPPAAMFLPDSPTPADGDVSLQAGTISGTMAELLVRVKNVRNVQAANFDLAFGTKRCAPPGGTGSQNACLVDLDCPAGESCLPSGDPVVRFVPNSASASGSFLDCGLPGTLQVQVAPDPQVVDQLIVGISRLNFQACSSGNTCDDDTDCVPFGELCGGGELCEMSNPGGRCCVSSVELCPQGTGCTLPDQCETRVCDFGAGSSGTGDILLRLTFEILDRGRVRVDFVDPKALEDAAGSPIQAMFIGGILEGV